MSHRCKVYAEGDILQRCNGQKKRPARKESGAFFWENNCTLAQRLDDQGANRE